MNTKSKEAFEAHVARKAITPQDFKIVGISLQKYPENQQYISSITETQWEDWQAAEACGRKAALEAAIEICKSVAVGGVDGRLASKTCTTKIQKIIK